MIDVSEVRRVATAFLSFVCVLVLTACSSADDGDARRGASAATSASTSTATTPVSASRPLMGAAVSAVPLETDPDYARVLGKRFDIVTSENAMKWGPVHPDPDRYDFGGADAIVDFAERHGQQVHGHNLVWHNYNPEWLTAGRYDEPALRRILRRHILTVAGRYRGRIALWDVVNEAVDYTGSLRHTIWLDGIGPEYLDLAFRWAHKADPDALLYYNDFGAEGLGPKSDAVYELVAGMIERGVPIDGVGLQMHTTTISSPDASGLVDPMPFRPDPGDVAANIDRLGGLGLQVAITELTVRVPVPATADSLAAQADVYADVMQACLDAPACSSFTTWGFTDRYSWIPGRFPGFGAALPFDASFRPKPAYDALCDLLADVTTASTRFCPAG